MAIDGGLHALFKKHLPEVDWQRIETGGIAEGVPDVNGCHAGHEFWIEYKQTDTNLVGLRPMQVGWHLRRTHKGGHTFIAIRQHHTGGPRKGPARDTLWLVAGRHAGRLKECGLPPQPSGAGWYCWHNGPAKWPWHTILQIVKDDAGMGELV